MKKRFAWMGLLVFLLAAAIHGAAWAAEERRAVSPVAMEISLLYGQRGKLGSYIPVSVRLYGQSAAQFEGTVWFGTLESGGVENVLLLYPAGAEEQRSACGSRIAGRGDRSARNPSF